MMNTKLKCLLALALLAGARQSAPAAQLAVQTLNKLPFARASETIELTATQLAPLGAKSLDTIHVKDAAGREVLCQAVDEDGDYKSDIVIFQSDYAPGEAKAFTVYAGKKVEYTKADFKAYGRFVRERFDDYAWENDRIAHRVYGRAQELWPGGLSSSAVDVWTKRVPALVINGWYMADDYHSDNGEGANFYSVGDARGDGGNGLWASDKLWVSRNFVDSHSLANGPIRVSFGLIYQAFDVDGKQVSEVKRITLDAGQNLDHFESLYRQAGPPGGNLIAGIGIRKKDVSHKDVKPERSSLTTWETLKADKAGSHLGCAIIVDPKSFVKCTEDKSNLLLLAKASKNDRVSYWAGFGWDRSGQFADYAAWRDYVDKFAQGLASAIEVTVVPQ